MTPRVPKSVLSMMRWGRRVTYRFLIGGAGALIFALVLTACSRGGGPTAQLEKRPAVPVLVAKTEETTVPRQLQAIGSAEGYSTVSVKSQVAGEITDVHFHEGQEVKKGLLLFTIDPRPFQAALDQAKANLAKTVAQSTLAQADAKRWETMYKVRAASPQQYEQARSQADALKASVAADQAAVRTAELNLQYTRITSPIDGRAGNLNFNVGNVVKVDADTPLVVIKQIKPIYVRFSLPERDLPEIRRFLQEHGLVVLASPPNEPDNPSVGSLSFIDNAVDVATGTVQFKGLFPNYTEQLWPGEFVNVTLTLDQRPNTIVVPSQAVQLGQNGSYVYVVKPDMTVRMQPVKTGITLGGKIVIEHGLKARETVVTDGQMLLVPGATVRIKRALSAGQEAVS
jgi:membrane fusion protein, multidrug efflux system